MRSRPRKMRDWKVIGLTLRRFFLLFFFEAEIAALFTAMLPAAT